MFRHNFLYAIRLMIRNPVFTISVLAALAFGIGANTAIFSVVDSVLFRDLPFKNPGRLVWIWSTRTDRDKAFFSIPDFLDFRRENRTLEQMVAFANWGARLTGTGKPERLQGVRMSAEAFQMLGVNAFLGRTLHPEDGKSDSARVVVLKNGLWKRRFGSSKELIGKTLRLNEEEYVVVGVLPENYSFFGADPDAEFAVPLVLETDPRQAERGSNFLRVFARLKMGVTLNQAREDMSAVNNRLKERYPETNAKKTAPRVLLLQEEIAGNHRQLLILLFTAVSVMLLICCANLASLILSRAFSRNNETAIRASLGASRVQIAKQFLVESILMSLLGGAAGLLLAPWAVRFLLAISPDNIPYLGSVVLDARVLLFTFCISFITGIVFGIVPAFQASKIDINEQLKSGSKGTGGVRNQRISSALAILELALSLILITGALMLAKSFERVQEINPGFRSERLLLAWLSLPLTKYPLSDNVILFYENIARRIQALPGVRSVGAVSVLPLSALNARTDFAIVGRPLLDLSEIPAAQNRWVSAEYFQLMGIPILKGREFLMHDTSRSPGVAVIDDALARRFWPKGNPVGARIRIDDGASEPREVEIVGIVGNIKHDSLEEAPVPTLYVPISQIPAETLSFFVDRMNIVVRTQTEPLALEASIQREVHSVDSDIPVSNIRTMDQMIDATIAPRRFSVLLIGLFAVAALLLAANGVYCVISYSVTSQTSEIGIRMALGAQTGDLLKQWINYGLKMAIFGLMLGWAGSFVFTKILTGLLFGVTVLDPVVHIAASTLLFFVALLASFFPAFRAARMDPARCLRAS
jgi:putative ABC transport system permease protein